MGNLKKSLENQQKINEAVSAIFDHFREIASYSDHIETMAEAQTNALMLLDHYNAALLMNEDEEPITAGDMVTFFWEVSQVYKLLKPFARMIGQINGNKEE